MIDFELINKFCQAAGVPGYENDIRQTLLESLKDLALEVSVDSLGSVIAIKRGSGGGRHRVQIAAHMDEIGFITNYIDDNGFIRFLPLGGFDPKALTSMRVMVHGYEKLVGCMGAKPVHLMTEAERKKTPEVSDFYIDLGLPVEEVKKLVPLGSTITRYQPTIKMGNTINSKSLDNRVSVYALVQALKEIGEHEADIYATFTVQEEVGLRGASVTAHSINPHFALAIDVTIANDTPGSKTEEIITKLGKGAGIKVLDGGVISDQRIVKFLQWLSHENEIPTQLEFMTRGGTDTAELQKRGKNGAIAGAISIPLRYMHQTIETVHIDDIRSVVQLIKLACENFSHYDWSLK